MRTRLRNLMIGGPLPGVVLLCCVVLGGSHAVEAAGAADTVADPLEAITRWHDAGNVQAAYETALGLRAEWEGDPLFDLYFGLAAIDSGRVAEGVFALERILVVTPADWHVRLEVARAYYLLGLLERARTEFETVLVADLPNSVRSDVASYLEAIKAAKADNSLAVQGTPIEPLQATQIQPYLQVGMGWDTNVNSAPGAVDFSTPTLGTGVLSAGAVSDADSYSELALVADIHHPLSRQWSVDGLFSAVARLHNTATAFDSRSGSGVVSLNYHVDALALRLGISGLTYYLDDARFQNSLGVNAELGYRFSDGLRLVVFGEFSELTYVGQDDRNSRLKIQGLNVLYAPPWLWSPLFSASAYTGDERSDLETVSARSSADREMKGAGVEVSLLLTDTIRLNAGMQYQDSRYTGVNPVFLVRRHDEFVATNLGLDYQWRPNWLLQGVFSYSENRSNIEINRYFKGSYSVAVRYNFD